MLRSALLLLGLAIALIACQKDPPSVALDDLPDGDATRGETLYAESINGAPTCVSCHRLDDVKMVGPGLEDYGRIAGNRVSGQSAEEYTYYSILRPAKYLVNGFSNVMYQDYEDKLSEQDIADLIAYLLSL